MKILAENDNIHLNIYSVTIKSSIYALKCNGIIKINLDKTDSRAHFITKPHSQ